MKSFSKFIVVFLTWDDIERIETAYEERQEFTGKDDLVFSSVNGTAKLSGHKWANHWNALMDGIGVSRKEWKEERGKKSYLVFIESLRNHNENLGRG